MPRVWEVAGAILCQLLLLGPVLVDVTPIMPSLRPLKPEDPDTNNIDSVRYRGRHQPGIHPKPSENLPIPPFEYPLGPSLPTEDDLDPRKLQRLLGSDYDPVFMSSVRPLESITNPNGTYVYEMRNDHPVSDMPRHLQRLSFKMPGMRQKYRVKSRKTRQHIRNYLWTHTYCPVVYRWRDLGERFWPRWIREGDCNSGRSCSIPAGMFCKPQERTTKTILWWHCRRKSCYWIAINYPIINKCTCSC